MARITALALVGCLSASSVSAQLVVHDPALLTKTTVISRTADQIVDTIAQTLVLVRRWARRLTVFVPMRRYLPTDPPRWRTWRQDNPSVEALRFMEVLNAGVAVHGASAVAPVRPKPDPEQRLPGSVQQSLAMLDLADSVLLAGADQTGRIRGSRRSEREALLSLGHVVAEATGSTTARVAVLSASALIGRRQEQSTLGLTASMVEQLILEAMQARLIDAQVLQMRQGALEPTVNLLRGSGTALRQWRQP